MRRTAGATYLHTLEANRNVLSDYHKSIFHAEYCIGFNLKGRLIYV